MTEPNGFETRFGRSPEAVFFSPGRVNLLGEHTDYNDGLVLPMAIGRGTTFTVALRDDGRFRFHSEAYDETADLSRDAVAAGPRQHWSDYLAGVLQAHPAWWDGPGLDVHLASDLPTGRGLSSSASLTLGFAGVLNAIAETGLDRMALAHIARAAENDYVGLACGLLDPFAVAMGREGNVLFLDCATLSWERVPVPAADVVFLLADTGVSRSLAGSRYNERRRECDRARALADASAASLSALSAEALAPEGPLGGDATALRRARHVLGENRRVRQAVAALRDGRLDIFGALMRASHESLRDDYDVSCPELDVMAELLWSTDGVLGAKMTGAGFGGAVVALVAREALPAVRATLPASYTRKTGRTAALLECTPSAGFTRLPG